MRAVDGAPPLQLRAEGGERAAARVPDESPRGTYELSYSASGEVAIPETPLGTMPNVNLQLFAEALERAFDQVAAAYAAPGCSQVVRYSRFDGSTFSVTFTVTCTSGEATATQTIRFTIRRTG